MGEHHRGKGFYARKKVEEYRNRCVRYDLVPEDVIKVYDPIIINGIEVLSVCPYTTLWICKCFCNKLFRVNPETFRDGSVKSCGCKLTSIVIKKYKGYEYSAKERDLIFDIDIHQFYALIVLCCAYCGSMEKNYRGLDRIDNSKGYTLDNVNPCCWDCNRAKGSTLSPRDLFNWAVRIVLHQEG